VISFRPFRNDDPPDLVRIWHAAFPGRAAYPLKHPAPLDRWLFAKPYFDPKGLIVAEEQGQPVGFIHAGFAANPNQSGLDYSVGIICIIAVNSANRHQKIGTQLLAEAEKYLRDRGAKEIYAGSQRPMNPFYFGLYGGSDSPGFLTAEGDAAPFFESHGYRILRSVCVFQRELREAINIVDHRFTTLRRKYEIQVGPHDTVSSWWDECVHGMIEPEPIDFWLEDKKTGLVAAKASVWEMEGFSKRWNYPTAGIFDFFIQPHLRRQGLGRFLLTQVLRYLHEQFFGLVEVQSPETNEGAASLIRSLGFQQVDVGRLFHRQS
jgi:ribosomal protein S18 acetylase RimI-like enzyme